MVASRTVLVRIRADADQFQRELNSSSTSMRKLGDESDRSGNKIDRFSGRLALIGQAAGALGPGLVPIIGASTQAVAGLATEFGFAALAAGSAVIAFQGVGTALKALSDARIEPTTANLAKAEAAMEQLSPAGQDLARTISGLSDEWQRAKAIAQGGMFPGIEAGISSLMTRLPELDHILATVSTTAGDLFAEGADSLASDRWDDLFVYLDTQAKPIMTETAHTVGSLTHAISSLIIAMDPLSQDFAAGLADSADQLDRWATGLKGTQDFEEFIAYVETTGPQVVDTIGSIASSLVSILEAGSGAGTATLGILKGFADALSLIADSPVGPGLIQLVSTLSLLALGTKAWGAASTSAVGTFVSGQRQAAAALFTTAGAQRRATMTANEFAAAQASAGRTLGKGVAGIAGLGLAALDSQHHVFGLKAASGALMGSIAGPWGAAFGGAVGLLMDFSQGQQDAQKKTDDLTATLDQQTGALTKATAETVSAQLAATGYQEAADRLGLSQADVIAATLKGSDAVEKFRQSLIDMANDAGTSMDPQVRADIQAVATAMESSGAAVDESKAKWHGMKDVVDAAADAYGNAAKKVETFSHALSDLNTFLDRRQTFRDYKQSIDDANAALNNSKATHREIATAIDNVARNAGEMASTLKGTARAEFLTRAIQDLRDMKGQSAEGDAILQAMIRHLRDLNGTHVKTTVEIHTIRTGSGGGPGQIGGPDSGIPGIATGGHVRGPGTRTSDSIPVRVSDYEYVVKAKAVEHYGVDFMDAVNSMRFAGGGLVTGDPRPSWPASTAHHVTVSAGGGPLHVTGVLNTPWGPAQIEGIARQAARSEISADRDFDKMLKGANR